VAYADVTGKPTLFSGSYADLTNKPTLFSGSYADLTNKPTIPTNTNELTNGAGYITSSSLTGLATETYVTTRGYITSAALSGYALTGAIPTDISQLTDTNNLLGTGGGGGGTTYITNTIENPFTFSIAGDDSTLREISNGESIKFTGESGIAVTTDAEGNITITGPSLTGLATETYVTTRGYITSSALTGLATETFVTTQGYITSSALTGLATESYVTSRGYITGLSWNDLTDKPNLAGTYSWSIAADDSTQFEISAGNLVKIKGAGGITTSSDADGNITITGAARDRLISNDRSVILNSNGTFSLPTLTTAPASPQAGQMALADGTNWDPLAQNNGVPYMVIYTGSAWLGLGSSGVTMDQVYQAVIEFGSSNF
jgi:hypothetical protein